MSERADEDPGAGDVDALANDTVPEAPADEAGVAMPSDAVPKEESQGSLPPAEDDGPSAEEAEEVEAADEAAEEQAAEANESEPASSPALEPPMPPEAPERAGRRVSRAGWRIGTRVTLGLAVASVLPSAIVLVATWIDAPAKGIDVPLVEVALGALALSIVLSLLLGLRLRADLSRSLSALEARLRFLASGQPSARHEGRQPAELHALDDVADLLCETLGALREREEAERARSERLFTLAERADAIGRGQLSLRLEPSDDVAEASLAAAVNRLVDALERRVVRLKSHARVLATGTATTPPAFDEGEDDPVALVEKRVNGLRPIPPLLHDIAGRLSTLSRMPPGESRVPDDLARLSEAIAQRARAAQALFDSLEATLPRLPRAAGDEAPGLTSDQQRALDALASELEELSVDTSLPRLVESLPDLSPRAVASRLAKAGVGT